jgi:hypothetical protein
VVKTAIVPCALLAAVCAVWCVPALGQREQFPSTLPSPGPAPSSAEPAAAPTATLEGTIQPPPAGWDPYATPQTAPPSLLPEDPYLQGGPSSALGGTFTTMRRFLDEVRFDYVWMPGTAADEFGISDVELSATFAIPFLYNTETPLLVTPGFAFHWWNGPASQFLSGQVWRSIDMPPRAYDAYLDAAWNPQATPWLGGELSFRVGVYSDFKKVIDDSVRFPAKGLAVLTFSPSFKIKAGVVYLDRYPVKILPAGGIVWTPNPDVRFEILFPNPKLSTRLTTWGNTEWWGYARGEYGGGAWTVTRVDPGLSPDLVGYNDLRFSVGLEFIRLGGLKGLFEAGVSFDRELRYRSHLPTVFYPNTTMFLRGGLAY